MINGFIRVASASPTINVGDIQNNTNAIFAAIDRANAENVKIISFPELCITGATLESLFNEDIFLQESLNAVFNITRFSNQYDMVIIVSIPYLLKNKLYDTAFVIKSGEILGIIPKAACQLEQEFSHDRIFSDGSMVDEVVEIKDYVNNKIHTCPFSKSLLFRCKNDKRLTFTIEIGQDTILGINETISAIDLASIVFNPSTNTEIIDYNNYYFQNIINKSNNLSLAYVSVGANNGESSSKMTFFSKSIIVEAGEILNERESVNAHAIISDIDYLKISSLKKQNKLLKYISENNHVDVVEFEFNTLNFDNENININRFINPLPYVCRDYENSSYAYKILNIQSMGLCKRLTYAHCENVVLGLSGGIDSSLALIVALRAFDILNLNKEGIHIYTMPCFGTTNKTKTNAILLANVFGLKIEEINLEKAVVQHFEDIKHDINETNVTYENAQARERTQILFDLANDLNAVVVGTGDLSEIALGWSTFNGDHMSSYNVNACIPKTLIRYMFYSFIKEYEKNESTKSLAAVLKDILNTTVSPELLPNDNNEVSQKTENIIGPYELNDFFLYYTLKYGFEPKRIYEIADYVFLQQKETKKYNFDKEILQKTFQTFFKRFVTSAYKRNCSSDAPSIGMPSFNNSNEYYFPSDVSAEILKSSFNKL